MGLSPSKLQSSRNHPDFLQQVPKYSTPVFASGLACQYKCLSEFRGQLKAEECMYTFVALIQQYFQIMKSKKRIAISDQLCKITPLGEVYVFNTNISSYHIYRGYVQMIGRIFKIISNLCADEDWMCIGSGKRLCQRITKLIYRFHQDDELLHYKILEETHIYLQKKKMKGNLLTALIRFRNQQKHSVSQQIKHRDIRFSSTSGNIQICSTISINNRNVFSNQQQNMHKQINISNFYPSTPVKLDISQISCNQKSQISQNIQKSQFSQTSCKYNAQNLKQFGLSFLRNKRVPHSDCSNKFYISPQYSINIMVQSPVIDNKQSSFTKIVRIKIKKERYKTQTMRSSCPLEYSQRQSRELPKNRTTLDIQLTQNPSRFGKQNLYQSKTKSVLDTMARLVQVREIASSNSYI